MSVMKNENEG